MNLIKPGKLIGKFVELEPLSISHKEDLRLAAKDNESVWTYFPIGFNGAGNDFELWFNHTMDLYTKNEHWPFAVRRKADQRIVGTTRFYDIVLEHFRLAIGSSWYIKEAQGTMVNPECRFLLLSYAFEVLNVNRVEFITDPLNLCSRSAMKILGAVEEGIIRSHMVYKNGYVRDSILFSIIKCEWSEVKKKLQVRLDL